jgi:hypothetical protein
MVIYTYVKKTNFYPFGDNQLNICKAFNLNVKYPHVISTFMAIYMQRGKKYPK